MINKILADGVKVGDIFPNNPAEAKKVYKDLIKQYHPDNCYDSRASDAIQALQNLYAQAEKMFADGTWEKSNYIEIKTASGKRLQINYQYHCVFELGEYFVCNKNIIYLFVYCCSYYYFYSYK